MTCARWGPKLGTRLDAAKARSLVPARLRRAQRENAIRSTWYFLEISDSNPALTHREKNAPLTGGCAPV